MIEGWQLVESGFIGKLNNYEKLWLWNLLWGGIPAVVSYGDCEDK
jgi:hypothetical protein|tara:strand:- start:169 stop:303 length:135 start_codon:yes stop_codon:yes gene_type:complete